MSYLSQALGPDETLVHKAAVHWIVFVWPSLLIVIGFVLAPATSGASMFLVIFGIVSILGAWIYSATTDLAVSSRKVIAKWGLISRKTIEQRLTKVDTVQVDQGILGRLLNYGSITVTGSGFAPTPIKNIADPLSFRRAVEAAEDKLTKGDE